MANQEEVSKILNKTLTLLKRIYNKVRREINKLVALVVTTLIKNTLLGNKLKKNWVIGASSGKNYIDNSAALHRYIMEQHPEIKIYWVINKNSPDTKKLKKVSSGNVVYRNSVLANIYVLLAKVHIVSHGKKDLASYNGDYFKNSKKIHLSHGIHAFKKMKTTSKRIESIRNDYDLYTASSECEKNIKKSWGIDHRKIYITGMPRYDELNKLKYEKETDKKILYMPTWRDWLVGHQHLEKTSYFNNIKLFLQDKNLKRVLLENGIRLNVYLHINMRNHFEKFHSLSNSNINILPVNTNIQSEILTSQSLITDYSSICLDFLYLNKPVVFFQFDLNKYLKERGSYIDMSGELFGHRVYNPIEMAPLIDLSINSEKNIPNKKNWQDKMFKYTDSNNCARVMRMIFENIDS